MNDHPQPTARTSEARACRHGGPRQTPAWCGASEPSVEAPVRPIGGSLLRPSEWVFLGYFLLTIILCGRFGVPLSLSGREAILILAATSGFFLGIALPVYALIDAIGRRRGWRSTLLLRGRLRTFEWTVLAFFTTYRTAAKTLVASVRYALRGKLVRRNSNTRFASSRFCKSSKIRMR
jgi:hypothetical protein